MTRGFLGFLLESCAYGKEAPGVGLGLCFACGRPGSRDGCSSRWKHAGRTAYWAELGEWSAIEGQEWPHERDLLSRWERASVHGPTASPGCTKSSRGAERRKKTGLGKKWWLGSRHRWADTLPRAFRFELFWNTWMSKAACSTAVAPARTQSARC
ncbi:unnamed protein product [Ectocarpus sp. 4 AP-2014]